MAITHSVVAQDGAARRGILATPHGEVQTPVFMPVGTAGAVKGIAIDDLAALDYRLILGNTYHLMLRPGEALIAKLGGLHGFTAFPHAMLTDSGGYQVFSLAERRSIAEEGVTFRSHLDGSSHLLTPEKSIAIQETLGADIIMAFDECPPSLADRSVLEAALARTTRWLGRSVAAWTRGPSSLFGIVQGGLDRELRKRHAEEVCAFDLPGYALGGFALGEEPARMHEAVAAAAPFLPIDRPRYLMGVGTPVDLLAAIAAGIDMFDCVLPTRCARNGLLFTFQGRIVLKNARFREDPRPLSEECTCFTCRTYSRAYLRHIFTIGDPLAARLLSLHNLAYYRDLMQGARKAISEGRYAAYQAEHGPRSAGAVSS